MYEEQGEGSIQLENVAPVHFCLSFVSRACKTTFSFIGRKTQPAKAGKRQDKAHYFSHKG